VNCSRVKFTVTDGAIRFGLGAIRGVGTKSAEEIIAVREKGGDFKNLADFCTRVGTQLLNRRVLEALIKCGALDLTKIPRAALVAQVDDALKLAQRQESDAVRNQISLFSQKIMPPALTTRGPVSEWSQNELLSFEKEALGFFITAHPLDRYERELRRIDASLEVPFVLRHLDGFLQRVDPFIHRGADTLAHRAGASVEFE